MTTIPIIARFNGITIRMYFQQAEHNPPHIHTEYSGYTAEVAINTGEIIEGILSQKELALIKTWIGKYKKQLIDMWNTQEFKRLDC